ncbi:hypothetical protein LS482_14670 [Sinomicrobium kalidii]|uniref:hypothetical protein n=1 Tax=Sinomicrobium kalidii TaxID=2900738 RepID=UPI001E2D6BF5|nr:hypothetical protein [Sinomicrobium kalidii]UGU14932.1 hypothetical protein LS482_14670 [Sinomicrobium kalidii]
MKNVKTPLAILVLTTLLFTACSLSDDEGIVPIEEPPFEAPTAEAFNALRDAALEDRVQTAQFNAEDGISFTSDNGVVLNISGECLSLNGDPVTGEVDLEYVELFEKGNMLPANRPTVGLTTEGDKALLISGGEFYVNVTQNGEALESGCNMQMMIPADLTGGPDQDMTLWAGTIDDDGNLVWDEREEGAIGQEEGVFAEGDQYFAFFGEFGWTNVDRFYNDPRPKTTLQVQVPEGFTNENCAVYLSYDGEENALAQLDTFDANTGTFSEHYGQIPVGLEMHVIFVTEEDDQWRYAIQGVTVAENDIYIFALEDTTTGSEEDLVNAINMLP